MNTRTYIVTSMFLVIFLAVPGRAESTPSREYSVKAGFLYKFIIFTEWPQDTLPDSNEPLVIAVIGEDPFGSAFDPIKDQLVNGRNVNIKRFKGIEKLKRSDKAEIDRTREAIRKCHLLFVCQSEAKALADVMDMVRGSCVLTVADTPGFLEAGGVINLVLEDGKVRFDINNTAALEARLKIGSQLLRLARKVIGGKSGESGGKK